MATKSPGLMFLDTHIVVWLYDALTSKFTTSAKKAINQHELKISPLVKLELQYLFEIDRLNTRPEPILASLQQSIGLTPATTNLNKIVDIALAYDWTRDPFDRLIVAEAQAHNANLLTADHHLHHHYPHCIW